MPGRRRIVSFAAIAVVLLPFLMAQQKGQWAPGQSGLNAGVLPEPGITYVNMVLNYSADSMTDSNGNSIPVNGSYDVWAVENWFSYVSKFKVLGGHYVALAMLPAVNGSLTVPQFGVNAGGYSYGDTFVEPVALGWHLNRLDTYVAYGFLAPTGRYTPGATDNVSCGYWRNHIITGSTLYLTKSKFLSANLLTDWEVHGQTKGSNETPGQTFTMEWGFGQLLPLDKQMKKLLQVGVIAYDQWQVTANCGTITPGIPASLIPFYSVHAIGFQTNFMIPAQNLAFFSKYEGSIWRRRIARGRRSCLVVPGL